MQNTLTCACPTASAVAVYIYWGAVSLVDPMCFTIRDHVLHWNTVGSQVYT